jgi:hypothetical protein
MGIGWKGSRFGMFLNPSPRLRANEMYQVFKRHADLGYLALSTGLSKVRLPGDIPFEEWDSWHTLILTDELSRVVRHDAPQIKQPLTQIGIHRCTLGPRRWQWNWSSTDRQLWNSSPERQVSSWSSQWLYSLLPWNHRARWSVSSCFIVASLLTLNSWIRCSQYKDNRRSQR